MKVNYGFFCMYASQGEDGKNNFIDNFDRILVSKKEEEFSFKNFYLILDLEDPKEKQEINIKIRPQIIKENSNFEIPQFKINLVKANFVKEDKFGNPFNRFNLKIAIHKMEFPIEGRWDVEFSENENNFKQIFTFFVKHKTQ